MAKQKNKNWFEVSKEGLRELQEGKPKHWILRELVQNAWDEETKKCEVITTWSRAVAEITVIDDNPEGFKNITDAFTLFAPTSKRSDPEKRGRYNLGEKQVLALCDKASIVTTKGAVYFDKSGRTMGFENRLRGSAVFVRVQMLRSEYEEMLEFAKQYLVPKHIEYIINGERIPYREPYKSVSTTLPTEYEVNGAIRRTQRKTVIDIHKLRLGEKALLYEMGLPVTEIDCKYSVDVQQKVPLSIDRGMVPQSFLTTLYAEVLNATYMDIRSEDSSEQWVRAATGSNRVSEGAVRKVVTERWGDKVVVATPTDANSIDEAIAHGFKVLRGSELSKEEWENVKRVEAIPSSTEMFGQGTTAAVPVKVTEEMAMFADFAQRVAKLCFGIPLTVRFATWRGVAAQYSSGMLTMNVGELGERFFTKEVTDRMIDNLIHELGHEGGNHTEHSYHEAITRISGILIIVALKDPKFFDLKPSCEAKAV